MRRLLVLLLALGGLLVAAAAMAQEAPAPDREDLRALAELLRKPGVQAWLETQATAPDALATAAITPAMSTQQMMAGGIDSVRVFLGQLLRAAPTLPDELARAWGKLAAELRERGLISVILLLGTFVALGAGLERLFWWASRKERERFIARTFATAADRLHAVGIRLFASVRVLTAFAVGSIGAFLLFDWPPLLKEIVLGYLLVILIVRLTLVIGRFLLAPGAERFRVVPMSTPTAWFWYRWSAILVGWFFFVKVTLGLLLNLGISIPAQFLIGLVCGIILVGLALHVVWRHPENDGSVPADRASRPARWLLSAYIVGVWLMLFTGSATPFFVGVVLLLLPIAIHVVQSGVTNLLRPAGAEAGDATVPSVTAVCLERGLRALLLIGGAYLVVSLLGIDLGMLTSRDTLAMRLVRGAVNAAIVVLIADFLWHLLRTWIDGRLASATAGGEAQGDEARRRARLRTLLPILRNVLFVILVVMAALMAMSAMGIQIGPLIAGAGVVGVAVGFGAQTLVKDIISGMFFLLDDAFRVGEYIESGSIRGTVESFSLRSIKLRHHRGALHTIPFGSLDKITNYSRDWVIDKMNLGVTYDTDLDKVKKIIKDVGKQLQANPEFAPHLIETLKMQGVEQFGDFAIQIRLKMMTRPGEQFVIRRRALAMIKKAFDANGIAFAFPTVTVAGGEAGPAVAQKGLELVQPATPAA